MTEPKHTPGALKAAEKILQSLGLVGSARKEERIAAIIEIIDRETAAPDMAEVLEEVLEWAWIGGKPLDHSWVCKVEAALQKAGQ